MKRFNVLNHMLVPEHKPATKEEIAAVMERYKITRHQLPKIRRTDPAIKAMEKQYGGVKSGDIVKIVRVSSIAGMTIAYRLVID